MRSGPTLPEHSPSPAPDPTIGLPRPAAPVVRESCLGTGGCVVDARERVLLELCLGRGWSPRQAADETGTAVEEVRRLLARVARQLRATLGPPG